MRKQTLTETLAASGKAGLYEVLCKGHPVERALLNDRVTGLSFMPAATTTKTGAPPAEILASRRTHALLAHLKKHYDIIIIDAPPLLPVIDARILANQVDQILLTMNYYTTPKRAVYRALTTVSQNAAKIAGIILNGSDLANFGTRRPYADTPASNPTRTPHLNKAA